MTIARELAEFASGCAVTHMPDTALEYAQMLVASTIASAALGVTIESSRIVREIEVERGGRPDSTAWFGAAEKMPAAAAARVNAVMSDAAASDDSDLRNIVHTGTPACAAALAVAEQTGATGEETLAAIVMGIEIAGRVNSAMIGGLQAKGFHGCIVAIFAAAAAAARLMKLDAAQTTQALALAATSMGGLHAAAKTSVAREYHAGLAAMLGINAAQAAAKGFIAEENVFETKLGFLAMYGAGAGHAEVTRDFGVRWSILTDIGVKLVPGGHPHHAVAEAAAQAAREGDVSPDDIETITISRPGFQGFTGPQFPTDLIGVAHSPAYFAAAGAADREFTWAHAFPGKINDPRIRGLLGKVRVGEPPAEHLERYRSGAIVTIATRGGRTHGATVYAPKGSAAVGIEWRDIEAKYRALVPFANPAHGHLDAGLAAIRALRQARDVRGLIALLR
jgi:2-methylcitrate dehydratase PrpD